MMTLLRGQTLISTAFVALIILVTTILVISVAMPLLNTAKDTQKFNDAKQTISSIDRVLSDLATESQGSRREIRVDVGENKLEINSREDTLKIKIEQPQPLEENTRVQEGNIVISSGRFVKGYESDIDSDGDTDLVLENDAIIFAINKSSSYINTTNFITMMKNKNLNVNIIPRSGIFVNNLENSSYGIGTLELTEKGDFLPSSAIRAVLNSTGNIRYEAIFTLTDGMDFVELEVKQL